jgi:cob(I)alamin adenosyltransferase
MDKIYTKTGDKGYTTNLLNKKYSKADVEMELQGGIDEINAAIGHLRSLLKSQNEIFDAAEVSYLEKSLQTVQYNLYLVGIEVSTEYTEKYITDNEVLLLEVEIDKMVDKTEPMESFIYYSGSIVSTYSHVIRTIIRRVERVFVRALEDMPYPLSYQYINRLSDFFFTLSRYLNHLEGIGDEAMRLR